jgi:hypothetical protein
MTVLEYPVFVILPSLRNLSAIAFGRDGPEMEPLSPSAVAVYFSSGFGGITFTADSWTVLRYFTMKAAFPCSTYIVSTSPFEKWTARRNGGNFTIGSYQDFCLFHVSDAATTVTGTYDLDSGDELYYQYSGSAETSKSYRKTGSIAVTSELFTVLYWHSADAAHSKSIAVQLASRASSLPYRRGRGVGRSRSPIVLEEYAEDNGPEVDKKISAGAVAGMVIGSLAGVALAIGVVVLCLRRGVCRREEECVYLYTGVADGM